MEDEFGLLKESVEHFAKEKNMSQEASYLLAILYELKCLHYHFDKAFKDSDMEQKILSDLRLKGIA